MPLPILLLGGVAAAAVGGLVGAAASSVNRDYELELNAINDEIEETVEEVQRSYRETAKETKRAIKRFVKTCETIHATSFRRFAETFGTLKHVEQDTEFSPSVLKQVRKITIDYDTNARHDLSARSQSQVEATGAVIGAASVLTLGAVGGGIFLVGQVFKGIKLMEAIDEAKEELARVKAETEKVRKAERQLVLIRRRAEEMDEVTRTLNRLFGLSLKRLEEVVAEAGTDFRRYTTEQKQAVKVSYHFFDALQQIMAAPLVDEKSKLTKASREALKRAREFLSAVEAV